MFSLKTLFRKELPCVREKVLPNGALPPCQRSSSGKDLIKRLRCPVCIKLKSEMDSIQRQAYRAGYDYMAWIVKKGPKCELVTFALEPNEQELRQRYGKDLISVVPL